MRHTTPTARLIARPQLIPENIDAALSQIGADEYLWRLRRDDGFTRDDGTVASDAEKLVEFAGRQCYNSWQVGLNKNVTKIRTDNAAYLENVLRSGHGSVAEHAQFTFHFHDVSRVATHEIVRHRAGVAISQESLRYVRLTDIGFRIPEVLSEHHDTIVSIVEQLKEVQVDLAEKFGLDDNGVPFHVKKEVTSALRRLAPMGLSTSMVWSANVRTLRHVIKQRTAPGAEEEIRFLFGQVAEIMRAECPALFGDFEHNDGAWVPKYSKV